MCNGLTGDQERALIDKQKSHPSKAQFDEVKRELSSIFGAAYFLIDDYLIAAQVGQLGMTLKIAVYVNGYFKGSDMWRGKQSELAEITPIARKFYPLKISNLYSAKQIKAWEKAYRTKAKAKANGVYEKWCFTHSCFSAAGAFVAHIKKHNNDIRILEYADYKLRLDQRVTVDSEEVSHG